MSEKDVIKKELKDVLFKLLKEKGISVYKIVIFGSFIKGRYKEDSDIDIIIVSRDFRDKNIFERVKLTTGLGRELVRKFKKPFDLIYYSDKEWEEKNFLIINEAKEYGEVIYG
ncbi:nucleotidyltransferase domain-containing protein [Candidatus Aminicenantes bacterium AH-873-B07]|jgi:predicted nucleotidyltransferase|nr:nucleotidyltransferase domain-containing protein [Candidatus Aminicenantes bacterium AH-873-B07]